MPVFAKPVLSSSRFPAAKVGHTDQRSQDPEDTEDRDVDDPENTCPNTAQLYPCADAAVPAAGAAMFQKDEKQDTLEKRVKVLSTLIFTYIQFLSMLSLHDC